MPRGAGPWIVIAGLAIAVIGVLVSIGALGWFGRLPGDLRIERPNLRVYVPITSAILVSIVLSFFAWLARRWR